MWPAQYGARARVVFLCRVFQSLDFSRNPHTPGKACETVYRFHMSLGAELAPLYFRVDILETPMNLFISVRNGCRSRAPPFARLRFGRRSNEAWE